MEKEQTENSVASHGYASSEPVSDLWLMNAADHIKSMSQQYGHCMHILMGLAGIGEAIRRGKCAWFLLYDGSSPDGRGHPEFVGRTTDPKEAKAHWEKCQNPYSTGKVVIVTDEKQEQASVRTDWSVYA